MPMRSIEDSQQLFSMLKNIYELQSIYALTSVNKVRSHEIRITYEPIIIRLQ